MRRFGALVLAFGVMLALSACAGKTTGATKITDASATLHASGRCDDGEACKWYWEYWPASQPRRNSVKTPVLGPIMGPVGSIHLSTKISGLIPNTTYRWVFCGSPNSGGVYVCAGPHGTFGSTTADPPPDNASFSTGAQKTLAEAWNGTSWAIRSTPNPAAGVRGSFLNGVSCTSATACTAVGYYRNGSGTSVQLAERWDGTSWTIQPLSNLPAGATSSALFGVSCTSATACTAVGDYFDGAAQVALAERSDGTSWTIQPIPNPSRAQGVVMRGVSCTSATACTAVGDYFPAGSLPQLTLAERWDGTTWTIEPDPNPSGQAINTLQGVSCTSAAACTAVGDYGRPDNNGMQAERWDGTNWTIDSTPDPSNASDSTLLEVSCTSAAACTAVGNYGPSATATEATLAERWDGTSWTIQPTPNRAGLPMLSGVACTSATACTAVGSR